MSTRRGYGRWWGRITNARGPSNDLALSFAAGHFTYIEASDLIPEVKHDRRLPNNLIYFAAVVGGIAVIVLIRVLLEG